MTLAVARHPQRDRAVVGQHVGEGPERLAQRLVDEQAAEAGAVDEQVTADLSVLAGDQVADEAALVLRDPQHVVADMADAAVHAVAGEEGGSS